MHLNQQNDLLLRRSYREGGAVRKVTLANVDDWSKADVAKLRGLLNEHRGCRRADRSNVEAKILSMLLERVPLEKQWRLFQGRPARKLRPTTYGAARVS
jgi:hypothetical protein